jgi:hypothetical protein
VSDEPLGIEDPDAKRSPSGQANPEGLLTLTTRQYSGAGPRALGVGAISVSDEQTANLAPRRMFVSMMLALGKIRA